MEPPTVPIESDKGGRALAVKGLTALRSSGR
jgi:hypothetical protein